ncbi:MAG: sulfatase-like hydrolase/transferase [Candidatus Latescibacteria bacterium]|nr:sulfatase-like hydrolase/transferase [Candidatus Latescibacterota bacterium]
MASDRPNVLLICTDHWSGLLTRGAGHPVVMTPTIDQLAQAGATFSQAYSACPSCIPARRSLMTGMSPRANGLRKYQEGVEFPAVQTMAQCFRDAGYQAYGVGKLHVSPQRNRIGFDDVLVEDQGRHQFREVPDGDADDYELFLAEQGYGGQEYAAGMAHNEFITRAWHLPEYCHPINWAAREMCKTIRRRDPDKPGFWYLSFSAPHPPMTPLQAYMDLYRDVSLDEPASGAWSADFEEWPHHLKTLSNRFNSPSMRGSAHEVALSRRAYYATLTQIDHQIRVVIGYLREAGLLNNTIVVFTSDHGHMVGEHGMWCMTPFYEMSAKIPLIVVPALGDQRLPPGTTDGRLADFGDIMPTLLDLAGIEIPGQVDQLSLVGEKRRDHLYGEHGEGAQAMRMIRRGDHKLIYYPLGNRVQLFDIAADPREERDLVGEPAADPVVEELTALLVQELYGDDLQWLQGGRLQGLPDVEFNGAGDRNMRNQRGLRFI